MSKLSQLKYERIERVVKAIKEFEEKAEPLRKEMNLMRAKINRLLEKEIIIAVRELDHK